MADEPNPDLIEEAGRGVWLSPDGVHLAVEANDGELEWLECDPVGGWLLRGMLDMVPDEWERLAQPAALLSRLADLTEAAGKERSTEWIRLCATLPPEEWPPAPAYKGPMVPAAELDRERDLVGALRTEVERLQERVTLNQQLNGDSQGVARKARAERDALQARNTAALALHTEVLVFQPCGHEHDGSEQGVVWADEIGSVCQDGYQYSICRACCCDGPDGDHGQHEVCADEHCPEEKPNLCWPCPTRRALQGEQSTEPVKRCCIGPFADGTHAVNCWQQCQDCHGDETSCRCRETAAQPTGEADRG